MNTGHQLIGLVAVVGLVAGCAAEEATDAEGGAVATSEHEKIIGDNDLVPVRQDGANVPEKYRPLVDAFGVMSMGCTATHIGGGLVLSAGHCFRARADRQDNVPCPNVQVKWGVRVDKNAYLTSTCSTILAMQQNRDRDYAVFRVSPAPDAAVGIDPGARASVDTKITIFSHPKRRPLEWSQTCVVKLGSKGGWGADMFSHQCDTEPGSSGATILDDTTLKVVGIHDGGRVPWNYATYLSDTPISEFVPVEPTPEPEPTPTPAPTPAPDTTPTR